MKNFFIVLFVLLVFAADSFAATNVSYCQDINSAGDYVLNASLIGGPIVLSNITGQACIKISVSDVVLDCDVYSLYEDGSNGTANYGIAVDGNANDALTNVTIENCTVSNYTTGLIALEGLNYSVITNNTLNTSASEGFYIFKINYVNFSNDKTYSIFDSAYDLQSSNNNIFDTEIMHDNSYGFRISSPSGSPTNNLFTNNNAYNNSLYGFYSTGGTLNNFTNNNASESQNGFWFTSSSTDNVLTNNLVYNNSAEGFLFNSLSSDNNLSNNTAYQNSEGFSYQ
ncbi:right-handed parallel beta-helix repeat-containing protein [Candidatus Micrarchaeota archaeon]|nr:right-handed parallel beta-helix repeat-containing protein [Candidatus Micrarchaeota archaeon]